MTWLFGGVSSLEDCDLGRQSAIPVPAPGGSADGRVGPQAVLAVALGPFDSARIVAKHLAGRSELASLFKASDR